MLLKYLLVAVIFYFIVKTSRNLMRAVRGELDAPDRGTRSRRSRSSYGWHQEKSSSNPSGMRRSSEEDIEDAKWEDL